MEELIYIFGLLFAGFGIGVIFMAILFHARDTNEHWIDDDEHECDGIHVVNIKGIKE